MVNGLMHRPPFNFEALYTPTRLYDSRTSFSRGTNVSATRFPVAREHIPSDVGQREILRTRLSELRSKTERGNEISVISFVNKKLGALFY